MTVGELIKELKKHEKDLTVVIEGCENIVNPFAYETCDGETIVDLRGF